MHLHDESSEVPPQRTNDNSTQLACAGCGKTGVSICAKCAKTGYRKAVARANPLQKRDPELYNRLDQMSRLSFEDNKKLWDEFCVEINAEDFYEYLPTFVEILQEGKWRTDALDVRKWLRGNLAKRVRRLRGPEDYGPFAKAADPEEDGLLISVRRPSWPVFDKRNGALTAFATQPFTEFAVQCDDEDDISPEEVIEGQIEQKHLQTAAADYDGHSPVMPADRESLGFLGRRTYAEKCESIYCSQMVYALEHDRPAFDKELEKAITDQQALAKRLGLDRDESEVLAVMSLLWDAGARMYLNFLDPANRKRVRNAWDRFDRRRKEEAFHQTLRDIALRRKPERQGENLKSIGISQETEIPANPPSRGERYTKFPDIDKRQERLRHNRFMGRFLDWLTATGVNAGVPTDRSQKTPGVVDLPCDLAPKEKLSYVAASCKGPESAIQPKLYSE